VGDSYYLNASASGAVVNSIEAGNLLVPTNAQSPYIAVPETYVLNVINIDEDSTASLAWPVENASPGVIPINDPITVSTLADPPNK